MLAAATARVNLAAFFMFLAPFAGLCNLVFCPAMVRFSVLPTQSISATAEPRGDGGL